MLKYASNFIVAHDRSILQITMHLCTYEIDHISYLKNIAFFNCIRMTVISNWNRVHLLFRRIIKIWEEIKLSEIVSSDW